ncbi:N-acetylmuramoyl-L-alanine amidase [Edaphobacter modestus]|uniref:N-acetylmuramoyl-L-alanine amidase n=2 Tax=Edaphobacter modestus TaxID=388466 RepID=A0A4Q7YQN8_9BACT|nr:N-acetylmuramoyl-L-alanine amidase [Edaphobacter modestus]
MVAQSQETARPPQAPPAAAGPAMQPAAPPKPPPAFYRNLIVLDAAHGGRDNGAQLSSSAVEKDVTLAFAQKLRPALTAQGFTVVVTRDSDPPEELTTDQRAGTANHVRPLACLVIHAAATGSGVHLVSSSLPESVAKSTSGRALVWNKAQAPVVGMSLRLANEVGLTIDAAQLPVLLLRASVPPLDNLVCPAIAIELAPLKTSSGTSTAATDSGYQQRAATAIAAGLASFRNHNAPAPPATPGLLPRPGVPQ